MGTITRPKNGKNHSSVEPLSGGALAVRPNQSAMANILLSGESTDKAKETDTFAFLVTDVIIPDEMKRVDVVDCLAAAGMFTSEDDIAYGKDASDSRNERMILKVVGHLGPSEHKYNLPALDQLADAWPSSRFAPIDLDSIGAYSYTEGGQLMANVSVLPFGGAQSSEVAYVAGVNLISNMYTAQRMEVFTRSLLYPTIVAIAEGLMATERLWLTKQSELAADTSLPEDRRSLHSSRATRSRSKVSAMEALIKAPGDLYQVSLTAFDFFDVNDTLDATARPTDRAEKGNNRVRTALANAFKAESGILTVLQRTSGIPTEWGSLGKKVSDRLVCTPLAGSEDAKAKLMGKFVAATIRLVVISNESAKMITECTIKTKLHVAACSGANAADGTDQMRPWGFDGYALDQLNNPVTSIERIPHDIDDDVAVAEWMHSLISAAAADGTKITCAHKRWTKDDGGAIDVQLDDNGDSAVMWQVEEWIHDANALTKQKVDPSGVVMHRTSVAHANPTPVKLKKAIVRTDGAGLKITDWCKTNRPGLPWFSTTPAEATASTEEAGSTAVVPGGRHGSFGAFVAHTELTKKETTKTMAEHGGQLTKLDAAMAKSQEMLQTLMAVMGSNSKETKELSGRVDGIEQKTDQIGAKADRIIAALEQAGMAVSPDAAAATRAPAATPAPPSGPPKPAQNPWMTATSGGGRGGGGGKRKPGRGMGGTVSEDYDGLDDDDEEVLPTVAARTRSSIARRIDAVRHMLRGSGAADGPGAVDTDASATAPDAALPWAERIKLLYDVGDGSDARVSEVFDAIQRTEGELSSAEIADMHF